MDVGHEYLQLKLRNELTLSLGGSDIYIPLQGKHTTNPEETVFDLADKIKEFFVFDDKNPSDPRVMLLMGDTGSGKSVFAQHIFQQLSQARKGGDPIPLRIPLPELLNPFEGAVEEVLEKQRFSEAQIAEVKAKERFIFIVDGYDELHQFQNCYVTNKWNQWNAKVLITCRSQALYYQKDPDKYFVPFFGEKRLPGLLRKLYVAPFSQIQIKAYVEQYNKLDGTSISLGNFDTISGLKDLITTPFLLHLTVQALPDILAHQKAGEENQKMTQAKLYDVFIERWFIRQMKKLEIAGQLKEDPETTKKRFWDYCKRLAQQMHAKEVSVIPYVQPKAGGRLFGKEVANIWESFFNEEIEVLRSACPLKKMGERHYGFIHASFIEYFATRAMYEEIQEEASSTEGQKNLIQNANSQVESVEQQSFPRGGIYQRPFTLERQAIQFLSDRVEQDPGFREKLLSIIEASKNQENYAIGAANAITALVRSGYKFNYMNLSQVKIPDADLSGGYFYATNFKGGNLQRVTFVNAWLSEAILDECQLEGIQFGENPWLIQDQHIIDFDTDEKEHLLIASESQYSIWTNSKKQLGSFPCKEKIQQVKFNANGSIVILICKKWLVYSFDREAQLVGRWQGDSGVNSIDVSPDGHFVVVARSEHKDKKADHSVRLYDLQMGIETVVIKEPIPVTKKPFIAFSKDDREDRAFETFANMQKTVSLVKYSDDGKWILIKTGLTGKELSLWSVQDNKYFSTGIECSIEIGPFAHVPNSTTILATQKHNGSGIIKLIDLCTGQEGQDFANLNSEVQLIKFNSQGDRLLTSVQYTTVLIWDYASRKQIQQIYLESNIKILRFTHDSKQILIASHDKTLRKQDIRDQTYVQRNTGYNRINRLCISDDETQVICVGDKSILGRWDIANGAEFERRIFEGKLEDIYTPSGLVLYVNEDRSIRVENDIENEVVAEMEGHTVNLFEGKRKSIQCAIFSPDGCWVASTGSDLMIRLWGFLKDESKMTVRHRGGFIGGFKHEWARGSGNEADAILEGHSGEIHHLVFTSDGKNLISGSDDKTVRVWNLGNSTCLLVYKRHNDGIDAVNIFPDNTRVISECYDNRLNIPITHIWNIKNGKLIYALDGYSNVKPIPESKYLAGIKSKQYISIIDSENGQSLSTINIHKRFFHFFFNKSQSFVIGAQDGSIECWKKQNEGKLKWRQAWSTDIDSRALKLEELSVSNAKGLSDSDREILLQGGAVLINRVVK